MKRFVLAASLLASIGAGAVFAGAGCGSSERAFDVGDEGGSFGDAGSSDAGDLFDSNCATAFAGTKKDPAIVEIVLDGSGSMSESGKWTAAVAALEAIFDDMLKKVDPTLQVGFMIFADSKDVSIGAAGGPGPYPASYDVAPRIVDSMQHANMRTRLGGSAPSSGTPTVRVLEGVYPFVKAQSSLPHGRKVVILVTDGVPNPDPTTRSVTVAQNQCLDLVKGALAEPGPGGPIQTFAIGIGPFPGRSEDDSGIIPSYDSAFMGDVAVAGGTRSTPQCDPHSKNIGDICYFQITPGGGKSAAQLTTELVGAINKIRAIVTGCEFNLVKTGPIDPSRVNVVVTDRDGQKKIVPQNPKDGWTYDDASDPSKVILHGQACTDVVADLDSTVSVALGCATLVR